MSAASPTPDVPRRNGGPSHRDTETGDEAFSVVDLRYRGVGPEGKLRVWYSLRGSQLLMRLVTVDSIGFEKEWATDFGLILRFHDGTTIVASFSGGRAGVDLGTLPESALPSPLLPIELSTGSPADGTSPLRLSSHQSMELTKAIESDPSSRVSTDRLRPLATSDQEKGTTREARTVRPPAAFDIAGYKCRVKIGEIPSDPTDEDLDEDDFRERVADAKAACAGDRERLRDIAAAESSAETASRGRERREAIERDQERVSAAAKKEKDDRAAEERRAKDALQAKANHDRDVRLGLKPDCNLANVTYVVMALRIGAAKEADVRNCRVPVGMLKVVNSNRDWTFVVNLTDDPFPPSAAIKALYVSGSLLHDGDLRFLGLRSFTSDRGAVFVLPAFVPLGR